MSITAAALLSIQTIVPYYFAYLALGFPGIYMAVRYSEDLVDTKDADYMSWMYFLWPFTLACVMAENAWSGIKSAVTFGRKLMKIADHKWKEAICVTATSAEATKREMIKDSNARMLLNFVDPLRLPPTT